MKAIGIKMVELQPKSILMIILKNLFNYAKNK